VLVGRSAVLIRGATGSGKSRLAAALIDTLSKEPAGMARLVADDRVHLFAAHGRLLAAAPKAIEGMLEIRGLGIGHALCEPIALVELIVDLGASDAGRMPADSARMTELLGVKLSRLPVATGEDALPPVLAAINALTRA
jgi:serine kinase of HPr protein (carbohydrate metabolism regulator)